VLVFFRIVVACIFLFELGNFFQLINYTPDYTWFGLMVTLLVIVAILESVEAMLRRKHAFPLPSAVWAITLLPLLVDMFGDFFHWYSRWTWYDQFAHVIGAAAAMFLFWHIIEAFSRAYHVTSPFLMKALLAYSLCLMFGSLYEIEEYLEDLFSRSRRLGDGRDTGDDLLMNLIGATFVFLCILVHHSLRKKQKHIQPYDRKKGRKMVRGF
jgi:heme exporter protein D